MLWGSDAVGGVINIITKRGKGKPTASAFVEYGSFASIREGVQATGQKGPVDFSMSLSRWDTSNFSTINYRRGATERDRFANWQISSRLGVALPKDGRLEVNARWWNSDFGLDSLVGTTPFDAFGSKQTNRMLILSGVYDQVITQWWSQKLTLAQSNEHFIGKEGPVRRNLITGAFQNFGQPIDIELLNRRLEWQHNFQVARPLLLTAGYQFREEQGDSSTFGALRNRLISTHAGFAQAQVNLQDRVLLTGGVRQDSYNAFGDATTYRVTGGYLIPETGTKLRTSYATGFRAPTLNQLYSSIAGFSGNPNLKPEESKSFDVGVDQRLLNDNLYLSAGYFWNRFDNLIVTGTTTFNQIGHAKSQGWEAALGYTFSRQLEVKGQYTYTLTRDLDSGRRIQRWPIHTASATVSYMPFERARINVDFRYVGSRFNDTANAVKMGSFDVVNISATYDVTKHMQVYGRIDNAFDEEYEEVFLFGTPIRSVYGGLKFTL
jgi:vitamin B12 transporter